MWKTVAELILIFCIISTVASRATNDMVCSMECNCFRNAHNHPKAVCNSVNIVTALPEDLEILELQEVPSGVLDNDQFQLLGTSNLRALHLSHAKINEIEPSAFNGLRHLRVVNLAFNLISTLSPDLFQNNTQLRKLKLTGNPLTPLHKNRAFLPSAPFLEELDLALCNFKTIPPSSLHHFQQLKRLDLSGNKIRKLDLEVFQALKKLIFLDISGNMLHRIDPKHFAENRELQNLNLMNNPWKCDCHLLTARKYLQGQDITTREPVMCTDPVKGLRKSWNDIHQHSCSHGEKSKDVHSITRQKEKDKKLSSTEIFIVDLNDLSEDVERETTKGMNVEEYILQNPLRMRAENQQDGNILESTHSRMKSNRNHLKRTDETHKGKHPHKNARTMKLGTGETQKSPVDYDGEFVDVDELSKHSVAKRNAAEFEDEGESGSGAIDDSDVENVPLEVFVEKSFFFDDSAIPTKSDVITATGGVETTTISVQKIGHVFAFDNENRLLEEDVKENTMSPNETTQEGQNTERAISFVVLGVIIALFVVILGTAYVKGRKKEKNNKDDEDNGSKEENDVKNPLLKDTYTNETEKSCKRPDENFKAPIIMVSTEPENLAGKESQNEDFDESEPQEYGSKNVSDEEGKTSVLNDSEKKPENGSNYMEEQEIKDDTNGDIRKREIIVHDIPHAKTEIPMKENEFQSSDVGPKGTSSEIIAQNVNEALEYKEKPLLPSELGVLDAKKADPEIADKHKYTEKVIEDVLIANGIANQDVENDVKCRKVPTLGRDPYENKEVESGISEIPKKSEPTSSRNSTLEDKPLSKDPEPTIIGAQNNAVGDHDKSEVKEEKTIMESEGDKEIASGVDSKAEEAITEVDNNSENPPQFDAQFDALFSPIDKEKTIENKLLADDASIDPFQVRAHSPRMTTFKPGGKFEFNISPEKVDNRKSGTSLVLPSTPPPTPSESNPSIKVEEGDSSREGSMELPQPFSPETYTLTLPRDKKMIRKSVPEFTELQALSRTMDEAPRSPIRPTSYDPSKSPVIVDMIPKVTPRPLSSIKKLDVEKSNNDIPLDSSPSIYYSAVNVLDGNKNSLVDIAIDREVPNIEKEATPDAVVKDFLPVSAKSSESLYDTPPHSPRVDSRKSLLNSSLPDNSQNLSKTHEVEETKRKELTTIPPEDTPNPSQQDEIEDPSKEELSTTAPEDSTNSNRTVNVEEESNKEALTSTIPEGSPNLSQTDENENSKMKESTSPHEHSPNLSQTDEVEASSRKEFPSTTPEDSTDSSQTDEVAESTNDSKVMENKYPQLDTLNLKPKTSSTDSSRGRPSKVPKFVNPSTTFQSQLPKPFPREAIINASRSPSAITKNRLNSNKAPPPPPVRSNSTKPTQTQNEPNIKPPEIVRVHENEISHIHGPMNSAKSSTDSKNSTLNQRRPKIPIATEKSRLLATAAEGSSISPAIQRKTNTTSESTGTDKKGGSSIPLPVAKAFPSQSIVNGNGILHRDSDAEEAKVSQPIVNGTVEDMKKRPERDSGAYRRYDHVDTVVFTKDLL